MSENVLEFGDPLQVNIRRDLEAIALLQNGKLISALRFRDLNLLRFATTPLGLREFLVIASASIRAFRTD